MGNYSSQQLGEKNLHSQENFQKQEKLLHRIKEQINDFENEVIENVSNELDIPNKPVEQKMLKTNSGYHLISAE